MMIINMFCASIKSKGSKDRCPHKALLHTTFCGKHIRVKKHVIWTPENMEDISAIKIQKVFRGFLVRNYFSIAGKGCLKRSICHNDEDPITFVEKEKVNPFDYFSFEENGKLWWFSFPSFNEWCIQTPNPINPCTKQPLSNETKERLRELYVLRTYRKLKQYETSPLPFSKIFAYRWMKVCQEIELKCFEPVNPITFSSFTKLQYYTFLDILKKDIIVWRSEHKDNVKSKRTVYINWISGIQSRCLSEELSNFDASFLVSTFLMILFRSMKESYPICFMILSSLYRM
jgi:hypothetical protein